MGHYGGASAVCSVSYLLEADSGLEPQSMACRAFMAAVLLNLLSCAYGWGSHRLKADLSYGIFLYHWPLINLIFFLELPTKVSHIPLFVCYLVSFLTLGVMSWYVVERRIVGARK